MTRKKKPQLQYIEELSVSSSNVEVIGNYIDIKTPILHFCRRHDEYHFAMPQNVFKSNLECCRILRYNKFSTQEFVKRSKILYETKFDYSKTEYKDSKSNVLIGCPVHGFVDVNPGYHLKKSQKNNGCNK